MGKSGQDMKRFYFVLDSEWRQECYRFYNDVVVWFFVCDVMFWSRKFASTVNIEHFIYHTLRKSVRMSVIF